MVILGEPYTKIKMVRFPDCGIRYKKFRPAIFNSKVTMLATGGHGRAYRFELKSPCKYGRFSIHRLRDHGLPLEDMEFVQFHPSGPRREVEYSYQNREEVKGVDSLTGDGERFMGKYAPNAMELASRDVVSRAIMEEGKKRKRSR